MREREASGEYSPAIINWYGVLEHLGYDVYYEDYNTYNPENFYQLVKELKPDYIFHPTYESLHTEFIKLQEYSKIFCIHSDDDWRFDNYVKYWIPFTDGAIGYQGDINSYLQVELSKDYFIRARYTFNPNTMLHEFNSYKNYNLTHLGGLHGNKKNKIQILKDKGVDVEAIDPKFTSYLYYLESFHKSKASICLTNNSFDNKPQSKTRLAEIPYYTVMISEWWPNLDLWNMEPNKDFILLDYSDKCFEHIDKILNDDKANKQMLTSARNILINKNTSFHEWDNIMSKIDEDYKPVDISKLLKQNYPLLFK